MPPITLKNSLDPLSWNVPITDKLGRPTPEFQRKWAEQVATNGTIPDLTTAAGVSAILDEISATPGSLLARGASAWGATTISAVLDTIGSARGDVLFRGVTGWAALTPGPAGQVLTSAGAGADPAWSAASGSGGGAASIQDDGSNLYIAMSDTDGQLVLDGGGDPIFSLEVLPKNSIPAQPYPTGFRYGGTTLNNAGTPNTKIDIQAFTGRDSTNAFNIKSTGTLTIDATIVGANGLDAGSLASTTSYFSFVIAKADGTTASLLSTSPTAPTLPTGYLYFRRVGAHRTDGSAHFIIYVQTGNSFKYAKVINDYSLTNQGTSAVILTLSIPTGMVVFPIISVVWQVSNSLTFLMSAISDADLAPSFSSGSYNATGSVSGSAGAGSFIVTYIPVNTSGQVRIRSNSWDTTQTMQEMTAGWIDPFSD